MSSWKSTNWVEYKYEIMQLVYKKSKPFWPCLPGGPGGAAINGAEIPESPLSPKIRHFVELQSILLI